MRLVAAIPAVTNRMNASAFSWALAKPRYAAATRDWNPIHWDHDSAVAAGLL